MTTTRRTPSNPARQWYNDVAENKRTVSQRTAVSLLGWLPRLGFGPFEMNGGVMLDCEWYRAFNLHRADRSADALDYYTPKPRTYNRGAVGVQIERHRDTWTVRTWRNLRNPDQPGDFPRTPP